MLRSDSEAELLRMSVRRMLADHGPSGPAPRSDALWSSAMWQGLGGLCLGDDAGALADGLVVMHELGRVASPLPIMETIVANIFAPGLIPDGGRIALALSAPHGDDGTASFDGKTLTGALPLVEGVAQADHLLILSGNGFLCAVAAGAVGVRHEPTPALEPGLGNLYLDDVGARAVELPATRRVELAAVVRLCLCARAAGAARRGLEAVIDYAGVRRQFGQPIGTFQAIQHKLATVSIILAGCELQLEAAARAFDQRSDQWRPLALSAIAFATQSLRQIALDTQHCFGAIGFAEEHEAPALFRRVHGDLGRHGGVIRARLELAGHVLGGEADRLDKMFSRPDDPAAGFRAELRRWLEANWSDEDRAARRAKPFEQRNWDMDFAAKLGRDGWTTLNWPSERGGMGATPFEQLAFSEELLKVDATDHPLICGCRVMAPEILVHGTPDLRDAMLPGLRAGAFTGCLGYSEPEAGSDLASLRTKAIRSGGDYIVNGEKIWTTDGHRASHMILAARTHPDPQVKHGGISLFIVPMDSPGIVIREMDAMYGQKFCSVFFDDVRIPATWRLGEENGGWKILSNALANERIAMGGFVSQLQHLLEQLVRHLLSDGNKAKDAIVRDRIGQLVCELSAGRQLALQSIELMSAGEVPLVEAAMAKVYASEFAQRMTETAIDLLGGAGLLGQGAEAAPVDGLVEQILRSSIMYVVGGGSNEIQRSLIARHGLGLGR